VCVAHCRQSAIGSDSFAICHTTRDFRDVRSRPNENVRAVGPVQTAPVISQAVAVLEQLLALLRQAIRSTGLALATAVRDAIKKKLGVSCKSQTRRLARRLTPILPPSQALAFLNSVTFRRHHHAHALMTKNGRSRLHSSTCGGERKRKKETKTGGKKGEKPRA
jgi:hypothetical protein